MLAAELIRAQGIEVLALFFETPFFSSEKAEKSARSMGLAFRSVDISARHLEVVKSPKHGYGGNMNPCIDCHALMFRIAGEMLEEEGAQFVFSGEVLGQRPMSQNRRSLDVISVESGLDRLLLRPLSARHLPETLPEEMGWVQRDRLMDFQGRSRKPQIKLAEELGLGEYPSPAGGCLLTEKAFSRRLKHLLQTRDETEIREIRLLKLGRHFKIGPASKLIVGRNRKENEAIRGLSRDGDTILTAVSVPGPTALLVGPRSESSLELAADITASYSDAGEEGTAPVRMILGEKEETGTGRVREKEEFVRYMI